MPRTKDVSFVVRIGSRELRRFDAALKSEFPSRAALVDMYVDAVLKRPKPTIDDLIDLIGLPVPEPTRGTQFLYWITGERLRRFDTALASLYRNRTQAMDVLITAFLKDKAATIKVIRPDKETDEED